jgi:hypothetical protein
VHREPRFNEVLLVKVAMASLGVGMLVTLVCFLFLLPSVTVRLYEGNSETERELRSKLTELRGTWDPRERQRLLEQAATLRPQLNGTLNRMLRLPDFDLLKQAVDYAGAMGEPQLRPALVELVTSPRRLPAGIKPKAMLAAERLDAWTPDELASFLTKAELPLRLAALEVVSKRRDAPWGEVIDLMANDDEVLREAAIAAVPPEPPPEFITELWFMVSHSDPDMYEVGLKALARVKPTPEIQVRLVGLLPQLSEPAQFACLDMIGSCRCRLPDASKVWDLAIDEVASPALRARALYCLEQTQSFSVGPLVERYPFMMPLTKYFAARCLLSQGHADAPKLLLDLLEEEDEATRLAARRLLAWMTGQGPGTGREGFERSLEAMDRSAGAGGGELPAPSYEFAAGPG